MHILDKIQSCKTMEELDSLRLEIVNATLNNGMFYTAQQAFIKKRNKIKRNANKNK